MRLRSSLYNVFYKPVTHRYGYLVQAIIYFNIFVSILILFLETEKSLEHYFELFAYINVVNITLFFLEYICRLYIIKEDKKFSHSLGRLKYAMTPMMFIDLLVLLPYIFIFIGVDLSFLRGLRILRIFKLFRLAKFSAFDDLLISILKDKKEEFMVIFTIIFVLLMVVTPLVYYFENQVQPDSFSSMGTTLWWAIITFTTVGYGDMYPLSVGGRIVTSFITILGISFYAIPGSIFTASLLQKINEKKERVEKEKELEKEKIRKEEEKIERKKENDC